MSVADLKSAAANLPKAAQAELAAWLLEQLPESSGEDAIDDSLAEARSRRAELDAGSSSLLSSEEFWRSVDSEH